MRKRRWAPGRVRELSALRRRTSRSLIAVLLMVCAGACADLEDQIEVGAMPQVPPPPRLPSAAASLSIPVIIDGVTVAPITGELLNTTKPDYASGAPARRIWEISTLVPVPDGPFELILDGARGVSLYYELTSPNLMVRGGVKPVFLWRRRGDGLVAASVDPKDPFASFHQNGKMTRRLGDPLPRLIGITRVRINSIRVASP